MQAYSVLGVPWQDRSGKSCPRGLGVLTGAGKALCVFFPGLKNQEIDSSPAFVNILGKLPYFPQSSS